MRERDITWGPTYQEMFDPSLVGEGMREEALRVRNRAELWPADLFNITWRDERGRVRAIRLPPELTGVGANILVLIGKDFPSGSHKVGPAYSALMEAELDGEILPGQATIVAPSSGNLGIGVAYVGRIKGYGVRVVMPEAMNEERREHIRQYGAELDLTPGGEGELVETLRYARERYGSDPAFRVVNQFEVLANYRFHRYVTGRSALEAAAGYGDGGVTAFVSAPGSAGTLAAGDEIKARFAEATVVAVEPKEAPFLFCGRSGDHRIGGIADGLVSLIHNVLNTDYVLLVSQEDCLQGLRVIQEGPEVLTRVLGVPEATAHSLVGLFGPSGVCNVLGAIKAVKALNIPAGHNVVTVATDGFDRYPSVLAGLGANGGPADQAALRLWARRVFHGVDAQDVRDLRPAEEKERLFRQKEGLWRQFGYPPEYLAAMRSPAFWEEEYVKVADYDNRLLQQRGELIDKR